MSGKFLLFYEVLSRKSSLVPQVFFPSAAKAASRLSKARIARVDSGATAFRNDGRVLSSSE